MNHRSISLQKSEKKIKVLYIAGPTRSGSTIISNILGQINGFFHAGELIEAWDRGRIWKCSCGEFPDSCPIWSSIFYDLDTMISDEERKRIIYLRDYLSKSYKVILHQFFSPWQTNERRTILEFTRGLHLLYSGIQKATGAKVIIDSSKNVGYGFILSQMKSIDLYVLHLIRDSRAVVFSWSKQKNGLWTESLFNVVATWNSRNLASELLKRNLAGQYSQVFYEEFMADPVRMASNIVKPFRVSPEMLPFISPHQVHLNTSHGLCGNPDRFGKGVIQLKTDTRWHSLKKRNKIIATALTWPLLYRYNYTR
jgi:hypothetical protein